MRGEGDEKKWYERKKIIIIWCYFIVHLIKCILLEEILLIILKVHAFFLFIYMTNGSLGFSFIVAIILLTMKSNHDSIVFTYAVVKK